MAADLETREVLSGQPAGCPAIKLVSRMSRMAWSSSSTAWQISGAARCSPISPRAAWSCSPAPNSRRTTTSAGPWAIRSWTPARRKVVPARLAALLLSAVSSRPAVRSRVGCSRDVSGISVTVLAEAAGECVGGASLRLLGPWPSQVRPCRQVHSDAGACILDVTSCGTVRTLIHELALVLFPVAGLGGASVLVRPVRRMSRPRSSSAAPS